MIDSVTITAHDKFDEIIAEAQSGNSIFNADGVIYADYEKQKLNYHKKVTGVGIIFVAVGAIGLTICSFMFL